MLCSRLLRVPERHGVVFRSSEWAFQTLEATYRLILRVAFRFRPVLMTAFSTVLGMLPIPRGFGAGGEVPAEKIDALLHPAGQPSILTRIPSDRASGGPRRTPSVLTSPRGSIG